MDGTLLLDGQTDVSEEAINLIDKLSKHEVIFAVASGRAYANLVKMFGQIKDSIIYICENGSLIKYKDKTIYKATFEKDMAKAIVDDIMSKDECEVLISGENSTYVIPKKQSYVEHMRNIVKNDVVVVNDIEDIEEDIIKISVYNEAGIDMVDQYFEEKWADKTEATVSGKCWQDFVPKGVNKGVALQKVQEKFDVPPDLTMCFGDNYNDIAMFGHAYFSYAMTTAKSEIRSKARYVAMSVENILNDVDKMINFNL